jgi:hypothetical protein
MLLGNISPKIKTMIVIETVLTIVVQVSALGRDWKKPAKNKTLTEVRAILARLLPTRSVVSALSKLSVIQSAFFEP